MKRIVLVFIILVLVVISQVCLAQPPPFPGKGPWYIEITGLDNFSLFGPTPGTYTGSDVFTVGVNWPAGATVASSISAFTPALANTAATSVAPMSVPQGITACTVNVSVAIVLLDAPGMYQATLTVTVTNKP